MGHHQAAIEIAGLDAEDLLQRLPALLARLPVALEHPEA